MTLWQSRIVRLVVCAALAVGVVAAGWLAPQLAKGLLNQSIRPKVDSLALYPPKGTPELQWAVLVYWTHNLHDNTIPQVYASYSSLRELDRFLDAAIAQGPTRGTIDGLWQRYASMSESGSQYRLKYEPIRDSDGESIAAEGTNSVVGRGYAAFLARVKASNLH